jgi:PAS domain S-box-containing protein
MSVSQTDSAPAIRTRWHISAALACVGLLLFCLVTSLGRQLAVREARPLPLAGLHVALLLAAIVTVGYAAWALRTYVRQRDRMDVALRESEEKHRGLYEMSRDAVMLLDEHRYLDCNEATLQVFRVASKQDFCRLHPAVLSPSTQPDGRDSLDLALERIRKALREGSHRFEWVHRRADGEQFPADVVLSPAHFEGRPVLQALVRDQTLLKQAEQALRQEQQSLLRLLHAHDQERKLIAYEIHDGVAQQLVAAIYQCQTAERQADSVADSASTAALRELQETLRRGLAETRRLISGVRPPILDEFGVVTAVQALIEDTLAHDGPTIEFRHDVRSSRLGPIVENTVYRIIQEGLANACRHSQSPRVLIEITETEQDMEIRVQDFGVGFDQEKTDATRFGLAGIRERTRLLRGTVELQSAEGQGTLLSVRLPKDVEDLEAMTHDA